MFFLGGIFLKGSALDTTRSLSDPTLLGHFAGSTEGGAVFLGGSWGLTEGFISKRLDMQLQQQQQQQLILSKF